VDRDPSNTLNFYDVNGNSITPTTDYVGTVAYNGTPWKAGQLGYDGWEFRHNDKFPVFANGTGWTGASILQTNIASGDIVHLFYDFPSEVFDSGILASNYVRGVYVEPVSNETAPTIQLQGHTTYINKQTLGMYVDNYKNLQGGVSAYLCDLSGAVLEATSSDVYGQVTFTNTYSGDYIVKTDPVYQTGYDGVISPGVYIGLTGAYSKVDIPQ
jgi:hypothetical protein